MSIVSDSLRKKLLHCIWGLFATMWNAGWNAAVGVAGIDGIALTGWSEKVHVLSFHEMLSAFCGGAVIHGILWVKSHPLPDTYQTADPFPVKPSTSL